MARAESTKARAKLDPKGAALVLRMKEMAQQATDSGHVGSVKIKPKNGPPNNNCGCACSCC
jgi:hypothetical protein